MLRLSLNPVCMHLSGATEIIGRLNYSNRTVHKFEATFNIICNAVPRIEPIDPALMDRIRIFGFHSKFVKDPALVDESKAIFLGESKWREQSFIQSYGIQLVHILSKYLLKYLRYEYDNTFKIC